MPRRPFFLPSALVGERPIWRHQLLRSRYAAIGCFSAYMTPSTMLPLHIAIIIVVVALTVWVSCFL